MVTKLKETSFRTRGFEDNFRMVEAYLEIELTPNSLNVGRKNRGGGGGGGVLPYMSQYRYVPL